MSVRHRYLLADPVTDRNLGTLPLDGVTYSRRIGQAGELTGGFPIATRHLGEAYRLLVDRPLAIYVERTVITPTSRRSELWWGGITWAVPPKFGKRSTQERCDIIAATFESYPQHRKIMSDYDPPLDVDRGELAAELWDRMQAAGPTAGVLVDPGTPTVGGDPYAGNGWLASSGVWYQDALDEVTTADPSFELTVDVWADPDGTRHRRLRAGTPVIGDPNRVHLLATPKTVVAWDDSADQTARPTHAMARGKSDLANLGADAEPLTSPVVIDDAAVADGVLRVDDVTDYATDDEDLLLAKAGQRLRLPNGIPSVTVHLPETAAFTPGALGDQGRIILRGNSWPGGRLDTTQRIIGVQVTPAERGRPEEVLFEFQTPAVEGAQSS